MGRDREEGMLRDIVIDRGREIGGGKIGNRVWGQDSILQFRVSYSKHLLQSYTNRVKYCESTLFRTLQAYALCTCRTDCKL
jgi:hypothetical protein